MHGRLNDDLIRFNPIQERVGKSVNKPSPDACPNDWPPFRGFANVQNGRVDLIEKLAAKASCLNLIILCCVKQLQFGRPKEANWLHLIASRASLRTSSADLAVILPLLYSR